VGKEKPLFLFGTEILDDVLSTSKTLFGVGLLLVGFLVFCLFVFSCRPLYIFTLVAFFSGVLELLTLISQQPFLCLQFYLFLF